jgi:hypothetical protein
VILKAVQSSSGIGVGGYVALERVDGVLPLSSMQLATPSRLNCDSLSPSPGPQDLTSQPDDESSNDDLDLEEEEEVETNDSTGTPQAPSALFIENHRKRKKRYGEYSKRMRKYLNHLGSRCGTFGILYLRSYGPPSVFAN